MGADAVRAALRRRRRAVDRRAVRVRRQLRGRQPRRRHQPRSGSPASRSWTSTTAAPPRPRALQLTADAIRSGQYDIGVAVGMDKHQPGAFTVRPRRLRRARLVRRDRPLPHHQVLRHEDQPLHARPRHLATRRWRRWRRRTTATGRSTRTPSGASPSPRRRSSPRGCSTTRSRSTCSARRTRAPPPSCCATPTSPTGTPRRRSTCGPPRCAPAATAPSRCTPRGPRSSRTTPRPCTRRRPPTRRPGIGPEDVDVIQLQDTDAGAEVIHMAENGFCADGEQEKLIADGATEIDRPACRSTPTAASSPTASRSAPPACARSTSWSTSSAGTAGDRQVAGRAQGRLRPALRRPGHRRRVDPHHVAPVLEIPTTDGLVFTARAAGPDDGRPVLLLHGFPQTSRCWTAQLDALAGAGHRAVAFDQRGYSPGARPDDVAAYKPAALVGDVLAVADALRVRPLRPRRPRLRGDGGLDGRRAPPRSGADPDGRLHARTRRRSRRATRPPRTRTSAPATCARSERPSGARPRRQLLADDAAGLRLVYARARGRRRRGVRRRALRSPARSSPPSTGTGRCPARPARRPRRRRCRRSTCGATRTRPSAATPPRPRPASSPGPYRFEVLEGVGHWIPELAAARFTALLLDHLHSH